MDVYVTALGTGVFFLVWVICIIFGCLNPDLLTYPLSEMSG